MAIPDAPTNLTAVAGDAQVELSFTAVVATPTVTGYLAEFSINGESFTEFDPESTNTTIIVLPLENNQLFFFRVFAVNDDGKSTASSLVAATPQNSPSVEYCTVNDIANRLRIDINKNTQVNTGMVEDFILQAQERIDRKTGHSWRAERQMRNDEFDTTRVYDWGHGMPLYLKHRQIKLPLDKDKGDKVEFWDGQQYNNLDIFSTGLAANEGFFHVDSVKGILYIRGWFLSYFRKNKFRITYRYGSDQEAELVPQDIRKCCILIVCIDILNTDFKMSQIPYGGEGNINKEKVMQMWEKEIKEIISSHKEIQVVW